MGRSDQADAAPVALYWRPGCGFCTRLQRQLDRWSIAVRQHNIWEDDEARAFVRSVARGHETVPTVVVDGTAMVNPSIDEVVDALARLDPELVPTGYERSDPGRVARAVRNLLGDR